MTEPASALDPDGWAAVGVDVVRLWVRVPATSVTDEQLGRVIGGELALQAQACTVPGSTEPYPGYLAQAIYRRVARVLAARQVPLGLVGDPASEAGAQRLAMFDAEIERLEGGTRRVVFG